MNAYATDTAPAYVTDTELAALVNHLAALHGRTFIAGDTVYTPAMRQTGEAIARAVGVPAADATNLPDGELTAYYSASRRTPWKARSMARRRFPEATQATPAPAPAVPEAMPAPALPVADMEAIKAALQTDMAVAMAGIEQRLLAATPRAVTVTVPDLPPVTVSHAHKILPRVLRKALKRRNVYLVGGMGTGKTTLAKQIADIMGLQFYMASSVFEEHKLFGFMGPNGYVGSDLRTCWEFGGVFLFDEFDRSDPSVVVAFNAFYNGFLAFPDKIVYRHADCVIIAAGNTPLRGANRDFNTAQKADNSVLDRYCMIHMDLDLDLETAVCTDPAWLRYCRALRAVAAEQHADLAVTPRASIEGAIAIAEGDTWAEAADGYIWKGLDTATRERLERLAPMSDYAPAQEGIL